MTRHNRNLLQVRCLVISLFACMLLTGLWTAPAHAYTSVQLVKDINSGQLTASFSTPQYLVEMGGVVYFSATHPAYGTELWKSDGTAAGTVMVKDIYPGSRSSSPAYLTNVNGTLFFVAYDPDHGAGLWKSDGTAAGTVMVKDITLGATATNIFTFTEAGGKVFFLDGVANSNYYGLWLTDGSASGTMFVQNFDTRGLGSYYQPEGFISLGNKILFNAVDKDHGSELWALSLDPAPFTTITAPTNTVLLDATRRGSPVSARKRIPQSRARQTSQSQQGGLLLGGEAL